MNKMNKNSKNNNERYESYEIIKKIKEENIKIDNILSPYKKSQISLSFLKWSYNDRDKLKKFKNKIKDKFFENFDKDKLKIDEENLKKSVKKLIPFSFLLKAKIELISPYFSRDDDEFYLIQNPCLKEKVFKFPMIRGSSWKGALAQAGKKVINESLDKNKNGNNKELRENIASYLRIFGTGSEEFRELSEMIEKYLKEKQKDGLKKDTIIKFFLFELGFKIKKEDIEKLENLKGIKKWIEEKLIEDLSKGSNLPNYLKVHKGRAIFYPTYFNKISLEIINPHDRVRRAGTNPINYEVVPKDTEGDLYIVYTPYDNVLEKKEKTEGEVKKDIIFLMKCIEKVSQNGVGAKTKIGWGRFNLKDKNYFFPQEDIQIDDLLKEKGLDWKNIKKTINKGERK